MKTQKKLYEKLCSYENLYLAYKKARKGKSKKESVQIFDKDVERNLRELQEELITLKYKPRPLKRFIVRDPKTRVIHASAFRDRIVHHCLINILEPIFEKVFIYDSFASRKEKGTHLAIKRFDEFKRKVTQNGIKIKGKHRGVQGYCLKSDIKHYFNTVDHAILLGILERKIKDDRILWLTQKILNNFDMEKPGKGMPLGNFTSQFFANVYLNELDYFVKHSMKAKFYIRYVDDFIILHRSEKRLEYFKQEIIKFMKEIGLELHPEKTQIIPLQKGITFLGYRVFYHHKLLRKRNFKQFKRNIKKKLELVKKGLLKKEDLIRELQGWFGYAQWANTYNLRKRLKEQIENI
ncbi:MAG: reverse transcriptase domain-containing protein [archaeon]|nr:reverse transcriptase domain-containing protein [archaeon]